MNRSRRSVLLGALTGLGTLLLGSSFSARGAGKTHLKERIIKIQARKFSFTPDQIVLKANQPVILEFTSLDFVHGFNIPDMGIRADLPPGQSTRVRLPAAAAGVYDFLCDNFCGSGHEGMSGKIIVKD